MHVLLFFFGINSKKSSHRYSEDGSGTMNFVVTSMHQTGCELADCAACCFASCNEAILTFLFPCLRRIDLSLPLSTLRTPPLPPPPLPRKPPPAMATAAQAAAAAFLSFLSSSPPHHTAPSSSVSFLAARVLPASLRAAAAGSPTSASRSRGRGVAAVVAQLPTA